MPSVRSAKSTNASNPRCIASNPTHNAGRAGRHSASGSASSSTTTAPHVRNASASGQPSAAIRSAVSRASGFASTCASAVPSSHDALVSFVHPLNVYAAPATTHAAP